MKDGVDRMISHGSRFEGNDGITYRIGLDGERDRPRAGKRFQLQQGRAAIDRGRAF